MPNDEPQLPLWPPPIVPNQVLDDSKMAVTKGPPLTFGPNFIFGFLAGLFISILCGAILFFAFVMIATDHIIHNATPQEWTITVYAHRAFQLLDLILPLFLCFCLRVRYLSFAVGLAVGGSVINLFLLYRHFFGI